jgi:hypothetical protein
MVINIPRKGATIQLPLKELAYPTRPDHLYDGGGCQHSNPGKEI